MQLGDAEAAISAFVTAAEHLADDQRVMARSNAASVIPST